MDWYCIATILVIKRLSVVVLIMQFRVTVLLTAVVMSLLVLQHDCVVEARLVRESKE